MRPSTRGVRLSGMLLAAAGGVVALLGAPGPGATSSGAVPTGTTSPPGARSGVHRLEADHPTYPDLASVKAAADVVVVGTAVSDLVEPGVPSEPDPDGFVVEGIPHTVTTVRVLSSVQGGPVPSTIDVVVVGDGTGYVLDGGIPLVRGTTYVFFLDEAEGRYYPLAGGSAVAEPVSDGTFVLSQEVSADHPITVRPGDLVAAQPPGGTGGSTSAGPSAAPTSSGAAGATTSAGSPVPPLGPIPSTAGPSGSLAYTGAPVVQELVLGASMAVVGLSAAVAATVAQRRRL